MRAGGLRTRLYSNSLLIVMGAIWVGQLHEVRDGMRRPHAGQQPRQAGAWT